MRRLAFTGGVFGSLAVGLASSPALAQDLIGYVVSVEGAEARLLRGEAAPRRLRLGENLLAGDTVVVAPPTRVRVDTVAGPVDPCAPPPPAGECRYRFPVAKTGLAAAEIASRLSAMAAWFSAPSRNLVTRAADPPKLRIGGGGPQSLLAGQRGIWVGWHDGEAPFEARLAGPAGVLGMVSTSERTARLPTVLLSPGPLALTITDRQGRQTSLTLNVKERLPGIQDLSRRSVNADHRLLLESAELAGFDGGTWSLEAAQRLADIADRFPLAETFRRALTSGDRL